MKIRIFVLTILLVSLLNSPNPAYAADIDIVYKCKKTFTISYGMGETMSFTVEKKYRPLSQTQKDLIQSKHKEYTDAGGYTKIGDESNRMDCGGYTMNKLFNTGVTWTTGPGFYTHFIKYFLETPHLKNSGIVEEISGIRAGTGDVAVYGGNRHIAYVKGRGYKGNVILETKDGEQKAYEHYVPYTRYYKDVDPLMKTYGGAPKYYRIDTTRLKVAPLNEDCECDESEKLGEELDNRITQGKKALDDCLFRSVSDQLEPIITLSNYRNPEPDGTNGQEQLKIRCRPDIDKKAQKIIDEAKVIENKMKRAKNNLLAAAQKMNDAEQAAQAVFGFRQNVTEALEKAKNSLETATTLLNALTDASGKCDRIKDLIPDLKTAAANAIRFADQVVPLYETTESLRREVCSMEEQAKNIKDKKRLTEMGQQASNLAKNMREPSKNAGLLSEKSRNHANRAREILDEINALLDEIKQINDANKYILKNARSKLREGLVLSDAVTAQTEADAKAATVTMNANVATYLGNEALKTVAQYCTDTGLGKKITNDAKAIIKKASTLKESVKTALTEIGATLEQINEIVSKIEEKLKSLADGDKYPIKCDFGELPDVKEAEASADTAELFAGKAHTNLLQAEECASRIRQMVLGGAEKSFMVQATADSPHPVIVPKNMRVTHWGERSEEGVDGWVPFKFAFSPPAGNIVRADFYLVVRPIGQLIETDTFHCLDADGKWANLYTSFETLPTSKPTSITVSITEETHPTVIRQLASGLLRCCVQDDTALFSGQAVIYWE